MIQILRYPKPPDLAKLGRAHGVVESSAGTGKTFLLEHLFVDLILSHGLSCEEILVVTFTEKATAELVIRMRTLLARLAGLGAEDEKAIAAAKAPIEACWTLDDRARTLLHEALLAFDRANIFTIHGFCQRVLRDHAFVQGRFFDEELIGEETAFSRAFHHVLRTQAAPDGGLADAIELWLASGNTIAGLERLLRACFLEKSAAMRTRFDGDRLTAAMAAWQPVAENVPRLRILLQDAGIKGNSANSVLTRLARVSDIVGACAGNPVSLLAAMQNFPSEPRMKGGLAFVLERLPTAPKSEDLAALLGATSELHAALVPLETLLAEQLAPLIRAHATRH